MKLDRSLKRILANKRLIAAMAVAIILFAGFGSTLLSGYTTGYEGAKAQFYGIYDDEYDKRYTNTETHEASLCSFDTTMKFDRDEYDKDSCNIVGEMTSIQIPLDDNNWVPPTWVPREWWSDSLYWKNPRKVYEWQVNNSDNTTTVFRMEEWVTKWYVSLSAEWDSGPDIWDGDDEAQDRRYTNLEIWIELDIQPTWYFEGQEMAYFAIGKIELANFMAEGHHDPRVVPMSPGSILKIYTAPFGDELAPDQDDFVAFYHQGKKLNPQYFRDKVYVHIDLADFGSDEWQDGFSWRAQGDAVTMGFTVVQFVVGQWTVQDQGDLENYTGRDSKTDRTGFWFDIDPSAWFAFGAWLWFVIIGVVAVALFWFFGLPAFVTRRRK